RRCASKATTTIAISSPIRAPTAKAPPTSFATRRASSSVPVPDAMHVSTASPPIALSIARSSNGTASTPPRSPPRARFGGSNHETPPARHRHHGDDDDGDDFSDGVGRKHGAQSPAAGSPTIIPRAGVKILLQQYPATADIRLM